MGPTARAAAFPDSVPTVRAALTRTLRAQQFHAIGTALGMSVEG
ncbi:hypothetical protein PUR61_01010 [Streptomyces sp. BE20]|nr:MULTISPECIES: hypothetical protein [unclassified Streptomyces]MED7947397.1 hypothetical protein [Streptomyces sp. BE303]MEE1820790.1 hypothetical protein [Streptomyces sp. BE20]